MCKEKESVIGMWSEFLQQNSDLSGNETYTAWHFCNDEENANELAKLVTSGVKRATASLYDGYAEQGETIPRVGDYSIITNWEGEAECIIQTKNITILRFDSVTEEMANIEGEGDKSLAYWREGHIKYFTEELEKMNREFRDDIMVVFEEFERVF